MRLLTLSCLTLLTLGLGVARPAYARETQTIYLRYSSSTGIVRALKLPDGLTRVTADAKQNAVIVDGSPEAIATVRNIVKALDVRIPQIIVAAQVWRFDFAPDGTWEMTEVSSPTFTTLNDIPANASNTQTDSKGGILLHINLRVVPHLNHDGTIGCEGTITYSQNTKKNVMELQLPFRRTLAPGKRVTLGLTDSTDPNVQKAVSIGRFPTGLKSPATAYYFKFSASVGPER